MGDLRVLHLMATGETSGGGSHLLTLLPALRARGVDCRVAVGQGPLAHKLAATGVDCDTLELMTSRFDVMAAWRLRRLVRARTPDLVHCHGTRAAFFAALARPFLPQPYVYSVHGLSFRKGAVLADLAFTAAEGLACHGAAHVLSVSRADVAALLTRGLVSSARVSHVPNAIDTERFAPGSGLELRAALGIAPTAFVVGTVARLVAGKAIGDLVQAVAKTPGVTLLVVGDGPERPHLEAQAQALGVAACFVGERDDVPALLRACDAFVLPSLWEGEPLSLLEALAVGLPCIATQTTGAAEVLDGCAAGRLVPIGDVDALAREITVLQTMPVASRRALSEAARVHVNGREPATLAARVHAVYLDTLR